MSQTQRDLKTDRATGLLQGPRPFCLLRGRAKRWAVSLGLLCFVLPHLYVVVAGVEAYPLTCAGMFAQQITPETPRYLFHLTGDDGQGNDPRPIPFSDIGASKRNFFVHAYGSASPGTCHPHFAGDTPEAFAERMSDWFAGFHKTWARKNPDQDPPARLTLWLAQIHPETDTPKPVLHFIAEDESIELRPDVVWTEGLLDQPKPEAETGGGQ